METKLDLKDILTSIGTPSVLYESEQYQIKVAENDEEVEKALRLRYSIFNLEQGKGLKSAESTGIDKDEFDDFCLHLVVMRKDSSKPVGTYRIHLGSVARSAKGFYSSREYDISGMEKIAAETMEVGRSCVSPEHRRGSAVGLLWGGIGELMSRAKLRYLFGCVSLESVDPVVGWGLHQYFLEKGQISELISAKPKPEFALEKPDELAITEFLTNKTAMLRFIPPVFKGYLRLGAKVCGEPALDSEFGTIDYLIILDTGAIPDRYSRHFNYEFENNGQ